MREARVSLFLVVGMTLLVALSAYAGIDDGLVAYWPLDGNAVDATGHGYDGILWGDISFAPGVQGGAATFDGADDRISITGAVAYQNELTISGWVQFAGPPQGDHTFLFLKAASCNLAMQSIGYHYSTQTIQIDVADFDPWYVFVPAPLVDGRWYHLALSATPGDVRVYLDGDMIAAQSMTGALDTDSCFVEHAIGGAAASILGGPWSHNGLIDEVRVYDRALSGAEVDVLAHPPEYGLVAYWPMDGDAVDATGHGYDGSLRGDVSFAPGILGGAATFDGADDRISITGIVPYESELSIAGWLRFAGPPQGDHTFLFLRAASCNLAMQSVGYHYSTQTIHVDVADFDPWYVFAPANLVDGQWYHLATTVTAGNVSVYLNGTLIADEPLTGTLDTTSCYVEHAIGGAESSVLGGPWSHNGLIDDVRVYNRQLSAAEVRGLAGLFLDDFESGDTSSWSYVTPPDPVPTADFAWSASPVAGEPVQFTDTSTGPPTSWAWTFGDGGSSSVQDPFHTFTSAGTYPVTLTATNESGSDVVTKDVVVAASEITINLSGGVPLEMVYIPAGTFQMGSPAGERGRDDREDLHDVTLTQGYYMGKYEVTQAQWQAVMGGWMNTCGDYGVGADYPVYCVSWNDIAGAGGFVETLNAFLASTAQPTGFRLPTDAEWERAARAGNQYRFSHGDVLECGDNTCGACTLHDEYMWWCGNNSPDSSKPVGSKLPNDFGLHDVHGNLLEWAQDWYTHHLGTSPVENPTGPPTGSIRVNRGGAWGNYAQYCRAATRGNGYGPDSRHQSLGFRLARTVD